MRMIQMVGQMFLIGLCCFALTGQAVADQLADARNSGLAGDWAKAAKLYRLLAEQGNVEAQINLGLMYEQGLGVLQDYKQAVKWQRLAAEQGDFHGQLSLGVMYKIGEGVPQNYVLAHMWTNIAATNGNVIGSRNFIVEQRDDIAKHMTAKQIAEAQELARKCTANKFKGC